MKGSEQANVSITSQDGALCLMTVTIVALLMPYFWLSLARSCLVQLLEF